MFVLQLYDIEIAEWIRVEEGMEITDDDMDHYLKYVKERGRSEFNTYFIVREVTCTIFL